MNEELNTTQLNSNDVMFLMNGSDSPMTFEHETENQETHEKVTETLAFQNVTECYNWIIENMYLSKMREKPEFASKELTEENVDDEIRMEIMRNLLIIKFSDEKLKKKLLETGQKRILFTNALKTIEPTSVNNDGSKNSSAKKITVKAYIGKEDEIVLYDTSFDSYFWDVRKYDVSDIKGMNILGRLLTYVRDGYTERERSEEENKFIDEIRVKNSLQYIADLIK